MLDQITCVKWKRTDQNRSFAILHFFLCFIALLKTPAVLINNGFHLRCKMQLFRKLPHMLSMSALVLDV